MPSWLLSAVRPDASLVFRVLQVVPVLRRRRDLLRVVADADHLHGDGRPPLGLERRQQPRKIRRLRRRVFHDQPLARGVQHLRRIEHRDIEGRLVALGRLQARDLVGAEDDGLGHRGARLLGEGGRENLAVRLVPGAREGRGDERLALRAQARGNDRCGADGGDSADQCAAIDACGHDNSPRCVVQVDGKTWQAARETGATWTLSPGLRMPVAASRNSLTLSAMPAGVSIS